MRHVKHLWQLIVAFFHRPVIQKTECRSEIESYGRWYFKRDILDRLDQYFENIVKLKRLSKGSYAMYRRLGAVVVSPKTEMGYASDLGEIPSFGAVSYTGKEDSKAGNLPLRFATFMLMKPSAYIEPCDGDIYAVSCFYTGASGDGGFMFHIGMEHGRPRLLKERQTHFQTLHHHDGRSKHQPVTRIAHFHWGYPQGFENIVLLKREGWEKAGVGYFLETVWNYVNASMDTRISVRRGNLTAVFSVDLLRMPYFFSDREPVMTKSGVRKRIFHIVRTHTRQVKDQTVFVKSHFRGMRRFNWHGYKVNITMPGFHHADIMMQGGLSAKDFEEDEKIPAGMVGPKGVAKELDAVLNV